MTEAAHLGAIFAFGLVMTGIVFLGIVRAREIAERSEKAKAARGRESAS